MIAVNVSSDTPTYGASSRPARISSTSTEPEATKTSTAASRLSIARAPYRQCAGYCIPTSSADGSRMAAPRRG